MPSIIHCPGTVWHSVRSRHSGSISTWSDVTVACQKLPPMTVNLCGWVSPMPTSASCVSAPPTTTGVPSAKAGFGRRLGGDAADHRSGVAYRRQHLAGQLHQVDDAV